MDRLLGRTYNIQGIQNIVDLLCQGFVCHFSDCQACSAQSCSCYFNVTGTSSVLGRNTDWCSAERNCCADEGYCCLRWWPREVEDETLPDSFQRTASRAIELTSTMTDNLSTLTFPLLQTPQLSRRRQTSSMESGNEVGEGDQMIRQYGGRRGADV